MLLLKGSVLLLGREGAVLSLYHRWKCVKLTLQQDYGKWDRLGSNTAFSLKHCPGISD